MHESFWKSFSIALDRLIEHFQFDSVQFRQITVKHDLNTAYRYDTTLNFRNFNQLNFLPILHNDLRVYSYPVLKQ